jgi:hypothetical protein
MEAVLTYAGKWEETTIDEDEVPEPPIRVLNLYNMEFATRAFRQLALDPESKEAAQRIHKLNYDIIEGNKAELARAKNNNEDVQFTQWSWTIDLSFFSI